MKKLISFGILLLFLTSCSQLHNLGFKNYNNNFTNDLRTHTLNAILYRDFTTIAIAKATHFNKELMRQYIEYTQGININKNKNRKYTKTINEFNKYDVYWVALYTEDEDINNISSKNSFWNVYLLKNHRIMQPADIKEIGLNNFKKQWLYLTKSNRWSRQYIVKFKKSEDKASNTDLVVSSFLGTMSFKFNN